MRRAAIAVVTIVLGMAGCVPPPPDDGSIAIGKPAPEIVATTVDGKPFRLSDLKGKVVVIDFWATWCGPCRKAMPFMKELNERYRDEPFVMIGISVDSNRTQLMKFIDSNQITWTQIQDRSAQRPANDADESMGGSIAQRWQIDSIPRVFVLDGEGIVRFIPASEAQIDRAIKNALSDLRTRN